MNIQAIKSAFSWIYHVTGHRRAHAAGLHRHVGVAGGMFARVGSLMPNKRKFILQP